MNITAYECGRIFGINCYLLRLMKRNKYVPRNGNLIYHKLRFCSKSGGDKSDKSPKSQLKRLLDANSPVKLSPETENIWATSPYPVGTVFEDEIIEETEELLPEDASIIMFPGQGNQFVGMGKDLLVYPVVKDMFSAASEILGYDLLKLCLTGPEDKLNQTEYCQPATLVCSLAALEKIKDEKPWVINNLGGTCGYSLGEFSALVLAGVLSFETGVRLVKIRAEAMSLCCKAAEGGMMTVLYGPGSDLSGSLSDAINYCLSKGVDNPQCSVASYLFPGCKVIGGHIEALNFLIQNAQHYKLRRLSKLNVSGAFHTLLMKDAGEIFKKAISNIQFNEPIIKVYSNVTGRVYRNTNDIKRTLPKQIYKPVKWEQTMQRVFLRPKMVGYPYVYECGPGSSLSAILKKVHNTASKNCFSVKL